MLDRFSGEGGARILLEALKEQFIVAHDEQAAQALATAATLRQLAVGEALILQHGTDNDLHFILCGAVDVIIHRRPVATRAAGLHVGEMALIDPQSPRSASVIAKQTTVVATVSETALTRIASSHPGLWRRIALELTNRLRERSKFIVEPNPMPIVFIGSSTEALPIAERLRDGLAGPNLEVKIWTKGVFKASHTTIEDLEDLARTADFAVLVATPDDAISVRGTTQASPRDNVLLELGIFIGALTRERTFLVTPTGVTLKLPTDLLGVTTLRYNGGPPIQNVDVSAACTDIIAAIRAAGPK